MAVSPVVTEVGFGSTPTVEPLNTDPAFEQIKTELTVDPLSTNLNPTTETINLGALRDMGFLPQPEVLVDQALHMGIDATTGLALDPATADLASQYKVAALANSPKFIEQGYRSDIMNAMAAGAFYAYVQTLEATDPASLDAYRIAEGNIYLTGQLADNRLVVTFVDDDGFHYLRSNTEGGDMLLAFIRDNNVSEQSVNAMIRRGIDKGMFSHVPHAAVESVAQVVLDNTPGLNTAAPVPAPVEAPPQAVAEDPFQNPAGVEFGFADFSLSDVPVYAATDPRAANLADIRAEILQLGVPFAHVLNPTGGWTTVINSGIGQDTSIGDTSFGATSLGFTLSQLRQEPTADLVNREMFQARVNHIFNTAGGEDSPIFSVSGNVGVSFLNDDNVLVQGREFVELDPVTGEEIWQTFDVIASPDQATRLAIQLSARGDFPISEDGFLTLLATAGYLGGRSTTKYDDLLDAITGDSEVVIETQHEVAELLRRQDTAALFSTLLRVGYRSGDLNVGVAYDPLNNTLNLDAALRVAESLGLSTDINLNDGQLTIGGQVQFNTGDLEVTLSGRTGTVEEVIQFGIRARF